MATAPTPIPASSTADTGVALAGPFYVDTHVHIYPAFDAVALLDAAVGHVRRHTRDTPAQRVALPVLMLTECRADRVFARWSTQTTLGPWRLEPLSPDQPALLARRDDRPDDRLVLVAGRQIITRERLEVLALGRDDAFADGHDLDKTIAEVRGRGALPVVPYGFGKWTGQRGTAVSRLIEAQSLAHAPKLVLGDNGGRPTFGPRPPQFDQAAAHRVTILPGTDPLPLRSCQRQAGRFGVRIAGPIDRASFVADLLAKLAELGPVPPRYGDHISLPRAIYQQFALRLDRKLLRGKGKL